MSYTRHADTFGETSSSFSKRYRYRVTLHREEKNLLFLFFSALMFVLPHSISNNEFLSSRCTKVKLFLVFFFKRYEISRPIVLRIKRVSERKSFFFVFFKTWIELLKRR